MSLWLLFRRLKHNEGPQLYAIGKCSNTSGLVAISTAPVESQSSITSCVPCWSSGWARGHWRVCVVCADISTQSGTKVLQNWRGHGCTGLHAHKTVNCCAQAKRESEQCHGTPQCKKFAPQDSILLCASKERVRAMSWDPTMPKNC